MCVALSEEYPSFTSSAGNKEPVKNNRKHITSRFQRAEIIKMDSNYI